ncbi:pyruvate kinase [Phytophthora cinnamomi]|uniref:pyruvate kinase n=1 Tax=Phytophthora cinnamomi TaxID=4785 RepID=UPI00355A686C|nr:pyruvate kinase [Phytophthora cinnamomi]
MSAALSLNLKDANCIKANVEGVQRKTKIFCTLGPACWSEEGLLKLIDAGMNVARFNFSHGDHASHLACLTRLRAALAKRPNKNVAIMLDTKGPEIRTGFLKNHDKVTIQKDSLIELTTDYEFLGDETKIACSYPQLPQSVKVGGTVLVADGSLVLTVTKVNADGIIARANNTATLGERKNMNLPGCKVLLPTLTEKDEDDLVNFGLVHGIDYISASFVRTGQDLDNIRKAETAIHYDDVYQSLRNAVLEVNGPMQTAEAVASSAVKTAIDINAKMLVVLTETGNTARLVAKFRPSMPVLVLTALEQTARQSEGFLKGVVARCVGSMIGTDSILYRATETGKELGWLKKGDAVVAVHGITEAKSGSTNLLKVLYVE